METIDIDEAKRKRELIEGYFEEYLILKKENPKLAKELSFDAYLNYCAISFLDQDLYDLIREMIDELTSK